MLHVPPDMYVVIALLPFVSFVVRRAPLRRPEISFSQGAEWKALINAYIGTIPLSGEAPCAAEQSTSDGPPRTVSSAMIAKVGAAARHSQSAAWRVAKSALALRHF